MPRKHSKSNSKETLPNSNVLDELRMVNADAAAELLGGDRNTLSVWRCKGEGPPFVKLRQGGIRYLVSDLKRYIIEGRCVPSRKADVTPAVSTT